MSMGRPTSKKPSRRRPILKHRVAPAVPKDCFVGPDSFHGESLPNEKELWKAVHAAWPKRRTLTKMAVLTGKAISVASGGRACVAALSNGDVWSWGADLKGGVHLMRPVKVETQRGADEIVEGSTCRF